MTDTLWYVVLALLSTAGIAALQALLLWLLPRVWPLEQSAAERLRGRWLARAHAEEMSELGLIETGLSLVAMVAIPFLSYRLMLLALDRGEGEMVVFWGGPLMVFLQIVAAIFLGPFATRWYIRARFGAAAPRLLEAYARSDDRHGGAGRAAMKYAGRMALLLVVASVLLTANRYTIVGRDGVEVARGAFGRETLPYRDVRAITEAERLYSVLFANGRVIDSNDAIGRSGVLSGFGKTPARAAALISARSGRPIQRSGR